MCVKQAFTEGRLGTCQSGTPRRQWSHLAASMAEPPPMPRIGPGRQRGHEVLEVGALEALDHDHGGRLDPEVRPPGWPTAPAA